MELFEVIYPIINGQYQCSSYFQAVEDMEMFIRDLKIYRQVNTGDIEINFVNISLQSREKYKYR